MSELTDKFVAAASQGEHTDGLVRGLILLVRPAGGGLWRRSWVLRTTADGRRRRIGLGAYPLVSLAWARWKARKTLLALSAGVDTSRSGKAALRAANEAGALTFGRAVDRYLTKVAQPFKDPKNDAARIRALRHLCAPLHPTLIEKVMPLDVAIILRALPKATAIKTQSSMRALFAFAMVEKAHGGVHFLNPASAELLKAVGYTPNSVQRRHPAPDFRRVPEFMRAVEAIDTPAARCLRFIALTASRSRAARLTRYDQIDRGARLWRCPPDQMKDSRHRSEPFVVPLSDGALDAIGEPGGSSFAFATDNGKPITAAMLLALMKRLRREHPDWVDPHSNRPWVIHGLRATIRSWAQAHRYDREVSELVLGHRFHGPTERAYVRGDHLLGERRRMLDAYADHCAQRGADVIAFPRG